MSECRILDTFSEFQTFWTQARHQSIEEQIEGWAKTYMAPWPELLNKQLDDYADEGEDWYQIARERVFPFLSARQPAMETAHANLVKECARVYAQAEQTLGFESEVVFVIYVGIGCGAGWATTFEETPAILFGLENVAACGWSEPPALTGLIAHEIGHLVHFHWRQAHNVPKGTGPWWQLYTEGFAQRCEHLIMGRETWHMRETQAGDDWLEWCRERQGWLAAEFLRTADAGESVRPFLGSWYDIEGHSQSGYFLGHELIKNLEAYLGMREIALLDSEDPRLGASLEKLAGNGE
jgi:hypothetical protein